MFVIAAFLALVAGYALQRGRICAVVAVSELIQHGRWRRFLSFLEGSAWAAAALLLAQAVSLEPPQPSFYVSSWTLAAIGGAVFGLGAVLNGSCAFGSASRLASGELSLLATFAGFVTATISVDRPALGAANAAPAGAAMAAIAALVGVFVLWRLALGLQTARTPARILRHLAARRWPPALAMFVIAVANVALMFVAANWSYLSVLADLTRGESQHLGARLVLMGLFFSGAVAGALTAGRFKLQGAHPVELLLRFGAGAAMGFGAALIPGGNDSLVLFGMPSLQAPAFVAYAAMVTTIGLALVVARAFRPRALAAASSETR